MEYKGFIAKVEYDEDRKVFFGQIINSSDIVTFEAERASQLEKEFKVSVDEYLSFCAEKRTQPKKTFSGKFTVRLSPEEHHKVFLAASKDNTSINEFVRNTILKEAKSMG